MALSKGCTIALIVAAVIVAIIILAVVLIYLNRDKLVEAGMDYMVGQVEKEIVANLPDGYTAESVHQIMEDFKMDAKAGQIDQNEMQQLAGTIQAVLADKKVDKEEGAKLLTMLQEAGGRTPIMLRPVEEGYDSLEAAPDTL